MEQIFISDGGSGRGEEGRWEGQAWKQGEQGGAEEGPDRRPAPAGGCGEDGPEDPEEGGGAI